jgi:DNA repair protein RecN (Recombination protein N)
MLKSLTLKDFVIVSALDVEFDAGFSVLTGETGAGKSILIDALQLALGARAEAHVVREGAARAEITAAFDAPASLQGWLESAGFDQDDTLLLRRIVDAKGGSRSFINGSAATAAQLREVADHLIDIHGQHAWQGLTRPASVRALLDEQAGIDTRPMATAFDAWRAANTALASARTRQGELASERERLQWQIGELERLNPGEDEWPELNAEHQRLAHAQALMDGAALAVGLVSGDDDAGASRAVARALTALEGVADFDARLAPVVEVLQGAQAQLEDAAHTLNAYLARAELDPQRLDELDSRMSAWLGLARRFRRPPEELAALLAEWRGNLQALDEAADLAGLEQRVEQAHAAWLAVARQVSAARQKAVRPLSQRVTDAMQQLGMAGGRFEVALVKADEPQSHGLESAEFLVAGHAGSAPRPLAKVASGGELSRLALAIAVTTAQTRQKNAASTAPATLIFDEIDSGVGGTVADSVGRLMKQLGRSAQVLAVTHLPQVAACADCHFVVAKATERGQTLSRISPVVGEARVAEVARMLGGDRASGTSLAHAEELIHRAVAGA